MPDSGSPPVTLQRILHPCVLLARGPVRVLVDPCFGSFTERLLTSRVMGITMPRPGVEPEALGGLSAIAITHDHEDHFDAAALARIPGREARVVVAGSRLERRVRRMGFRSVVRLEAWAAARGEGWSVTAVPARSPNAPSELSYVVDLGGFRIFHGGDTALHGAFAEIGRRMRPEAALLPVNGVALLGLRLTMTPAQAARAAAELGVATAVPIHDEMAFGGLSRLLYRTCGDGSDFRAAARRVAPALRVPAAARGEIVRLTPA